MNVNFQVTHQQLLDLVELRVGLLLLLGLAAALRTQGTFAGLAALLASSRRPGFGRSL